MTPKLEKEIRDEIARLEAAARSLNFSDWAAIGAAIIAAQSLRWVLVQAGLET